MDSEDYSYGEAATNVPDKTGGVSKLAGITFGTEEDSFHSDEFDRELGRALAVGTVRRQQLKKGKDRFLGHNAIGPDGHASPESSELNKPRGDGTDVEKPDSGHGPSRAQRNVNAPITRSSFVNNPNTPRLTSRATRPANTTENVSSVAPRNLLSTRRPSRIGTSRFQNGQTSSDVGEGLGGEDSNMSSLHQTLNDSAAFALSPPVSPEVSRRNSSNGGVPLNAAGKKSATGVNKRSLASDTSRGKGAHLTLREQEKVNIQLL